MAIRKRAYSDEEKYQREQLILDAAQHLLMEKGFHDINMSEVARTAKLAKGTVYLYFQTKEELFLTLFERHFGTWLDTVEARLNELTAPIHKQTIVDILIDNTVKNRQLIRLAALSNIIFEHNISYDKAYLYKVGLHERIEYLGNLLANKLDLQLEQGILILYRLYVFVIGLENIANPAPVSQAVYNNNPALTHPDFADELRILVAMVINSL